MATTILIISVCYIAVVSLVLKTFRYMRDRNIMDPEMHQMENSYKQSA
ncbi:MAG: hypothetical protein JST21_13815 [Bacteroidetes bacterium]|nr:hypothetical protein [Bacteroidota bacterium]